CRLIGPGVRLSRYARFCQMRVMLSPECRTRPPALTGRSEGAADACEEETQGCSCRYYYDRDFRPPDRRLVGSVRRPIPGTSCTIANRTDPVPKDCHEPKCNCHSDCDRDFRPPDRRLVGSVRRPIPGTSYTTASPTGPGPKDRQPLEHSCHCYYDHDLRRPDIRSVDLAKKPALGIS